MSRCGLRKLYLRLKYAILMRYYAVNRTNFSARLAYGKMTLLNFSFLFRGCEVKIRLCFADTK